jgi:hypothetical protein
MKIVKRSTFALIGLILIISTFFFPSTDIGSTIFADESSDDDSGQAVPDFMNREYVVFAWNNLGMHCANPSYDTAVLLPPYNTLWAQVVKRGNPPQIVTQNLTVDYSFINNTYSYGKGDYGQFWDNSQSLFGVNLARNTGLNLSDPNLHNGLSGPMATINDHFEAEGVPITPIDDSNTWNPYQVAEITVKDSGGNIMAQTRATAPVSDEINCAKCHGSDPFNDILTKHDQLSGTTLQNEKPVLCARCHGDPALGSPQVQPVKYLSESIHGFHGQLVDPPSCYDCHPGPVTRCSRSISHSASDGNCTTCHGDLSQMGQSIAQGRIPWASEPKCASCHTGMVQVDTGANLYRDSAGHGGIYCASCHSSPHAMVPSSETADNYQAIQYQGKAVPIGDCAACHLNSKGGGEGGLGEYLEEHGGSNPEEPNTCNICHTSVNTINTDKWPHSFQWRMQTGSSTSTYLTSSLNPSSTGEPVTFTASVSVSQPQTDLPSGTVVFKNGSTTLGSVPLDSSAQAVFTTSTLLAGPHNISAVYSGDFNYNGSISNTINQLVKSKLGITPDLLADGDVGITYNAVLQVDNGSAPYTWSIINKSKTFPRGLKFSPDRNNPIALITGKPSKAGQYEFTVVVTDGSGSKVEKPISLKINPAVKITVPKPPNGDYLVAYTTLVPIASGGTGPGTYTWSITSKKTLPLWISVNPVSGVISGTPDVSGSFTLTLTATDELGSSARKSLTIKINKLLSITTISLPDAKIGSSYSKSLRATGGSGKYTWTLAEGSDALPAWVDLNKFASKGRIASLPGSKPVPGGPYNLKFKVSDTLGGTAESGILVLTIK